MGEMRKERFVLMCGYLPGVSEMRSPLLSPELVLLPEEFGTDGWEDVFGGGCGFAMATSESGKLITWGSADDLGQSYLTSGKHEETPEAFPLPTEDRVVKAAAGWAHCITVTDQGEVYAWGWKECVPTNKSTGDQSFGAAMEKDGIVENGSQSEQESPKYQVSKSSSTAVVSGCEKKAGENNKKRRRVLVAKQAPEGPASAENEEASSAVPCLVMLGAGVRITAVAAGGRHTLALSDAGQVWGWGYGGEGQLGLGTRIRTVSSPQPVPCLEPPRQGKDELPKKDAVHCGGQANRVYGNCVKAIACGGRHSVAVTDTGALLTFGWGLHGQCGQGGTDDELSPTCVSSLLGIQIQGIAAGLWHTVCTSVEGDVYAFGGNQFGQLGTGSDHVETLPKLVEAPSLENKNVKAVSCGARHSAVITEEGSVFCWGWNKYGQLGLGDATDRSTPSEVQIDGYQPKNVSCGWWHTLVMAEPST